MTDNWDPSIPSHKEVAHGIEIGNGIPEMRPIRMVREALVNVGFEIEHEDDLADCVTCHGTGMNTVNPETELKSDAMSTYLTCLVDVEWHASDQAVTFLIQVASFHPYYTSYSAGRHALRVLPRSM